MSKDTAQQGLVDLWVRLAPAEDGNHRYELGTSPVGGESPGKGFVRVEHIESDVLADALSPFLAMVLYGLLAAYRTSGVGGQQMNKTFRDTYPATIRRGIAWADKTAQQIAEQERAK